MTPICEKSDYCGDFERCVRAKNEDGSQCETYEWNGKTESCAHNAHLRHVQNFSHDHIRMNIVVDKARALPKRMLHGEIAAGKKQMLSQRNICVVGNGPLSDSQRRDIKNEESCPFVIRFNDMKNKESNDKTSLQVARERENTHIYEGYNTTDTHPVILVGNHASIDMKDNSRVIDRIELQNENMDVFENCRIKVKKPTSGTLLLNYLNTNYDGEIKIYGMNWNMFDNTHDKRERILIEKCCKRCIVHKTPNNSYLPRFWFWKNTLDRIFKWLNV